MSYDIAPVGRTPAPAPTTAIQPIAAPRAVWTPPPTAAATAAARAVAAQASVTLDTIQAHDTIPASPPAEVHEAMAVAAAAYHNMQASDREVRFMVHESTGKLSVEIHDTQGTPLYTVPSSKALDVAAGGSLD